jgi:hypothetical protein
VCLIETENKIVNKQRFAINMFNPMNGTVSEQVNVDGLWKNKFCSSNRDRAQSIQLLCAVYYVIT